MSDKLCFDDVFCKESIEEALAFLGSKTDSCGVDGMCLSSLPEYWQVNGDDILEMLSSEKYKPGMVRKTEIINYKGKRRNIAVYNSIDRLILRCLSQAIQNEYDHILNKNCFSYRPDKGTEAAAKQAADFFEEGYLWTLKMDISEYYDNIDLKRMEILICENIKDAKICRLIIRFLHTDVEMDGEIKHNPNGLIQGSPLSPFLSNLYLTQFDNKMEEDGMRFCRFGDDYLFCFKSILEAQEKRERIRELLWNEYRLAVNESKNEIFEGTKQRFLGYEFKHDRKNGKVLAYRKRRNHDKIEYHWNRSAIERVDKNYHIVNNGILCRKDYNVLFENENGKKYIPVETVGSLNIYSDVNFSSGFFRFMNTKRLYVNIFDKYGNFVGYFSPADAGGKGKVLLNQVELYLNNAQRLKTAKAFEIGAMHNVRSNLRYYSKHRECRAIKDAIEKISETISKLNEAKTVNELMLIEARGRQTTAVSH